MPFWQPVAIAFALAVGLFLFELWFIPYRARIKAKRAASAAFRAAFLSESIAHLEKIDASILMNRAQPKHDAAISEFRRFVHPKQLEHFDAAAQILHQCRSELQPLLQKIRTAIDSNKPVDHSDIARLKEAIAGLLAFADET